MMFCSIFLNNSLLFLLSTDRLFFELEVTRCYGFSIRLPGMRPHWMIDTFTSLEDVLRWVDPWRERAWEEPGEADESRTLVSKRSIVL
jgi:hypothetical protein